MTEETDFEAAFASATGEQIELTEEALLPATAEPVAEELPQEEQPAVEDEAPAVEAELPVETPEPATPAAAPTAVVEPVPALDHRQLAAALADEQERRQKAAQPAAPAADAPREFTAEDFLDEKQKSAISLLNSEWGEVASAVQPLIAASVKAALANQERQILSQVQQHLAPIQQVTAQSQEAMYWASIQQAHPDFKEAAAAIPEWIEKQSPLLQPRLREVYQKGTAGEVVELISAYKQAIGSTGAAPAQPASSAAQVPQRVPVPKAALAATAAPPVAQRSAVATSRDPNDFDSAFAEAVGAR